MVGYNVIAHGVRDSVNFFLRIIGSGSEYRINGKVRAHVGSVSFVVILLSHTLCFFIIC